MTKSSAKTTLPNPNVSVSTGWWQLGAFALVLLGVALLVCAYAILNARP